MEEAIDYVREVVEDEGPFDAIIGFSQVRSLNELVNASTTSSC